MSKSLFKRIGTSVVALSLELKAEIIEFLKEKGHEVVDYGTYTTDSCDCFSRRQF